MENTIRKTFKYRCYPNEKTKRRLYKIMKEAITPIWNACILERKQAWESYKKMLDEAFCDFVQTKRRDITAKEEKRIREKIAKKIKWPTQYGQYKHVRKRDHPEYTEFNAKMMECTVSQVDGSYKSYLSLKKNDDKKARPPRETNLHRCITFRQSGWTPREYEKGRLCLNGIGSIRIRLHRAIEGAIKTVSVIEKNRKWYVCFSVEI